MLKKILVIAALLVMPAGALAGPDGSAQPGVTTVAFNQLPAYSAPPFGSSGREPVSFVYIGTKSQITNLFYSHGWYGADSLTPSNLLKAYRAAEADAPYPTAPFSPAFINGSRQDLSFQLPTEENTIRLRHHTRIWDTNVRSSDGRVVWVGTASYDNGLQNIGRTSLPVHSIDPDLDAEREFILDSLELSGVPYIQMTPGGSGANTFGNPTYTDGRAAVINLAPTAYTTRVAAPKPAATPAASPTPRVLSSSNQATAASFSTRLSDFFQQTATRLGF